MKLEPIVLPTRYERLQEKAQEVNEDLSRIVVKVDTGINHLQDLFRSMHQTELGRFEVMYGVSGIGKTTFLTTLPLFFDKLSVYSLPADSDLSDGVSHITQAWDNKETEKLIAYIPRDNPRESDQELHTFFETLRTLVRKSGPDLLVIWSVTLPTQAERLYRLAHEIGRDSLVGRSETYYQFKGPNNLEFYTIADNTAQMFNNNACLAEFGIDERLGTGLFTQAPTIAEYFAKIIEHSNTLNSTVANILQAKPRPRVWIVLCGDEATEVQGTVNSLTFGNQRSLDVSKMTADLSERTATAQYMKEWHRLGAHAPYLLRMLNVKVVEIPPNLALAIVRAFGDEHIRDSLKQQTADRARAVRQLSESMLGELILESPPRDRKAPRKTPPESREEFSRIQRRAKAEDRRLNRAFALAIQEMLQQTPNALVKGERHCLYGSLVPDIQVELESTAPICLEFTWRTTSKSGTADGETGSQNTLSQGHIRKYVLEKVYEYIKALDLHKLS